MSFFSEPNNRMIILGVIPLIAMTGSAISALTIVLIIIVVLFFSSLIYSFFPENIDFRTGFFLIVIITATVTTISETLARILLPHIHSLTTLFIMLVPVNSYVVNQMITKQKGKKLFAYALTGIKNFLFSATVLLLAGIVREIFGRGTLFNQPIITSDPDVELVAIVNSPACAFIVTAMILGFLNLLKRKNNE